ncbi:MAG: DUF552 domain-containing protein [Micrococcales bacterium]|nr:DUF552 domain-containing protein [Micrococcales bacterium]NBR54407.1 DUF552 domain-containing protein [Micrococcales bacterium]NBR60346.1 DUF552 domain-containing protein [Actinomycetota bacterium]NBT46243.1 DUF552 domain-containing protein [Actinomycetota bacterium]
MSGVTDWLKDLVNFSGKPNAPATPRTSSSRAEARPKPQRSFRGQSTQRIETVNLTSYADAMVIADILREGVTAVINVSNLSGTDRARLIDFMAGLKAGLLAQSSRVAEDVYLLAPEHVEIEPEDEDIADEDDGDRLIVKPN